MRKFYLSLGILLFLNGQASAQTYADDVAPIMFEKCTGCHHNGGIAPMPFMNYAEVLPYAASIQLAVTTGAMPPWPPNSNYAQYAHDRSLSAAQISTINDWVNNGAIEGNPANTPAAPVYVPGSVLGPGDLSVRIPDYISKATMSNDDYVCISVPINIATNQTIQAVEIIPGDRSMVHHVLMYIDPAGTYPTDTMSHTCAGPSSQSIPLVTAYVPGSPPSQYPNSSALKLGVSLAVGSRIIFAMHYPEGSQGKMDSTRINLHFYPPGATGVRNVSAGPILANTSFTLNANTVDSVDAWFPNATTPVPVNFSLFGIFPHTHLLGQSFIVYAVNHFPPYNKIPLMHIPSWDFDWQGFYVFKYMKKVPVGYKLYGKAIYDNTTNNPYNPNTPPQNVSFGLNTSDEMFLVYFQYLTYQTGDENINIDSLLQLQNPTGIPEPLAMNDDGLFLTTYPNPSNDLTTIHYYSEKLAEVSLGIYDIQGKLIKELVTGVSLEGEQFTTWDGTNSAGVAVAPGMYFSQLRIGDKMSSSKILRSGK
jgi:hypothetical protein